MRAGRRVNDLGFISSDLIIDNGEPRGSVNRELEKIQQQITNYKVIDIITAHKAERHGIFVKAAGKPSVYQDTEVGTLWKISEDGKHVNRIFSDEEGIAKTASKRVSPFQKAVYRVAKRFSLTSKEAKYVVDMVIYASEDTISRDKGMRRLASQRKLDLNKVAELVGISLRK